MKNYLLRCPNRHILGEQDENGSVKIRHRGRTTIIKPPFADVRITCEQCGHTVDVLLDGQADIPYTIRAGSETHFSGEGQHEISVDQQR